MTGNIALLSAALIWGLSFVAQSVGMEQVGPFTFQAVRCLLGATVLTVLSMGIDRAKKSGGGSQTTTPQQRKRLLVGGICCGLVLCVASNLQQIGIQYTTVAKSGFITSMYIVIVPILSVFLGRIPGVKHWLCVALAAVGLYFLSVSGDFALNVGDAITLLCALGFACHILVIDHFAPGLDGIWLSCIQFWVAGLLSCIPMALLEQPAMTALHAAWLPIAYAGVMSCAGGYTLQIIGQQRCDPVVATVLMSLESVFSLLGGLVILHQVPTVRELLGCALMFTAVLLSQLPVEKLGKH